HAQADVSPTTNLSAGYVADIVTSASIDIVTQASKSTIHDARHQGSFGLSQIISSVWTLRGAYLYSVENDYASHNFSAGIERRLPTRAIGTRSSWAAATTCTRTARCRATTGSTSTPGGSRATRCRCAGW